MKVSTLPADCQEQYDRLIDYINTLPIDTEDKQCVIDRVDDLVDWLITSDQEEVSMSRLMYTNKQGISFYKKGNRYYKNTGWREVEISKEEYEKGIEHTC